MRIDFETGAQQPFTAGDKVSLSTKALQNQTIGIIGKQFISATVDAPTAAFLPTMTQQNLTDLAAFIGQHSSTQVLYAHIAYDINGNVVTNYYLGIVAKINYVPNNGQDIANAVHLSPLGYITDQFASYGYDAYIIGQPPVGTFHYKQTITTKTDNWISLPNLLSAYSSEQAALDDLRNKFLAEIQNSTQQAYAAQGINVNVISANVLDCHLEKASFVSGLQRETGCKFVITFELVLDSDIAFQNSPIAPLVIAALILLAKILAAAVVIAITVYLIVEWLKAMTTQTYTSEQTTYGWVANPNTGVYEWKPISTKTESGTNPDIGGILSVGSIAVIGVVVVVVVILAMLGFRGGSKK